MGHKWNNASLGEPAQHHNTIWRQSSCSCRAVFPNRVLKDPQTVHVLWEQKREPSAIETIFKPGDSGTVPCPLDTPCLFFFLQ